MNISKINTKKMLKNIEVHRCVHMSVFRYIQRSNYFASQNHYMSQAEHVLDN